MTDGPDDAGDGHPSDQPLSSDFEAVFVHSPAGLALVDLDGRFDRVSPAWSAITGYPEHELLGQHFAEITHPDDLELDQELVEELLRGERTNYRIEKRYRHATGDWIWVELRAVIIRVDGEPDHFVAAITDISARQIIQRELGPEDGALAHRATHDRLTGLPNQVLLDEHLRVAAERVASTPVVTVVLVCAPALTEVPHGSTDAVLLELATRMRDMSWQGDVVARIDLHRFAIVADVLSYPVMALRLAERLVAAVHRPIRVGSTTHELGVSVGVTVLRANDEPDGALARAIDTQQRVATTGGGYAFAPGELRSTGRTS